MLVTPSCRCPDSIKRRVCASSPGSAAVRHERSILLAVGSHVARRRGAVEYNSGVSEDGIGEELWSRFPTDARPRPVIFADRPVHLGEHGFADNDSKVAYLSGAITSEVDLPSGVLALLTNGRHRPAQRGLRVVGVHAVTAPFRCDRGPRLLPAINLEITGMRETCTVLDPAIEAWWPPRQDWNLAERCGHAEIDPDGMTLHYWTGGGQQTEFLGARFREFDTYVIASAITRQRPYLPGQGDGLVLISKPVTGRLTAPLGDRVLLTERGYPCVITASGTTSTSGS